MDVQATALGAIEAPRHEVGEVAFAEQVGGGHVDARRARHLRVGELDAPVRAGAHVLAQFVAAGARGDAVELEDPRLVTGIGCGEGRLHSIATAIPQDDGLGPRTAGRRSHLHDLGDGHRHIALDDAARLFDQSRDLDGFIGCAAECGIERRLELQCAECSAG